MKFIIRTLTIALLMLPLLAGAQKMKETTIKKGKEQVPACYIHIKHSKALTQQVMKEETARAGLKKAKHKKGFTVYQGVVWRAISGNTFDYYYKVKGNKRKATIYFIVSKGYDNYVTSANDPNTTMGINTFLTDLDQKIDTRQAIDKKQDELNDLDKEKAKKEKEIEKLKGTVK